MGYQVSPGIVTNEVDLTTGVPAVASSDTAIAGLFRWGPVEEVVLVSSEEELVDRFGKPTNDNFETFFSAASHLAYSGQLFVSRAADANAFNGVAGVNATLPLTIKNEADYEAATLPNTALYLAKYPGALGNSLRVSVCDSAAAYGSTVGTSVANTTASFTFAVGASTGTLTITNSDDSNTVATSTATAVLAQIQVGDILTVGTQKVKVVAKSSPTVTANGVAVATLSLAQRVSSLAPITTPTLRRAWEFADQVSGAPGTSDDVRAAGGSGDELHVIVVDEGGAFTGQRGAVLEVFDGLSRARGAKSEQGASIYYADLINLGSRYIWWANDREGSPTATTSGVLAATTSVPLSLRMTGGTDSAAEDTISLAALGAAWDVFKNSEAVDVSLLIAGKARGGEVGEQLANYITDNIVDLRQDCVLTVTPARETVVANAGGELTDVVEFRNALRSSSYVVLASGYKQMYDKYNDVYRMVPTCGDITGLMARTDSTRDPWVSPAGPNRGHLKNVVKLSWNPNQAERDVLYKNAINPIVTFPGQGTMLYGDKTLLAKPSAFDRINVRRLFIVLKKAIRTASKTMLFEFNDEFTRAAFRNMVEPYLRDVQGRRGLYDFRVVCDESNNKPEVIDRNEFRGDIYLKPAKSINFIQLNFVAVRTGVDFEEIVGSV